MFKEFEKRDLFMLALLVVIVIQEIKLFYIDRNIQILYVGEVLQNEINEEMARQLYGSKR